MGFPDPPPGTVEVKSNETTSSIVGVELASTARDGEVFSCAIVTVRIDQVFDFENKNQVARLVRQLQHARALFFEEG